ncbi:hypothetical protein B9N43_05620 [Denitratisoma sp. DHT3]|uniref:hypothetical protein n=1 Tax=Denitratisoma sp. DHT3 TaxID=1981880 RepID=UPI00119851E8|nr:hypothetical protein [Denitratisoma sp. DHT3]QDX80769.1 hypothetical protein B9N43_05620 [Denitratisoma sp. DHT3]
MSNIYTTVKGTVRSWMTPTMQRMLKALLIIAGSTVLGAGLIGIGVVIFLLGEHRVDWVSTMGEAWVVAGALVIVAGHLWGLGWLVRKEGLDKARSWSTKISKEQKP